MHHISLMLSCSARLLHSAVSRSAVLPCWFDTWLCYATLLCAHLAVLLNYALFSVLLNFATPQLCSDLHVLLDQMLCFTLLARSPDPLCWSALLAKSADPLSGRSAGPLCWAALLGCSADRFYCPLCWHALLVHAAGCSSALLVNVARLLWSSALLVYSAPLLWPGLLVRSAG